VDVDTRPRVEDARGIDGDGDGDCRMEEDRGGPGVEEEVARMLPCCLSVRTGGRVGDAHRNSLRVVAVAGAVLLPEGMRRLPFPGGMDSVGYSLDRRDATVLMFLVAPGCRTTLVSTFPEIVVVQTCNRTALRRGYFLKCDYLDL
jgi:hypothetical protein